MKSITSFHGEHDFLSNFYGAPVEYEGDIYPTVEHAFQAAKTNDQTERLLVRKAATPGKAKRLGREVRLRPDWENVRIGIMEQLVRQKFESEPLQSKLLATGDAELVEGNTWGDTFWGVCRGKGENNLGKILMKIRTELEG